MSQAPPHAGSSPDRPRRQAVVIIHGVGDQRPLDTLRRFVESVAGPAAEGGPRFFSKPDRVADTLELRRLASWPPHVPIPTDFYELYWAHLMEGTSWQHVTAWFRMLLLRNPMAGDARVRTVWAVCWATLLGALWYMLTHGMPTMATVGQYGVPGLMLFAAARYLAGSFGLHYAGDAARYLSPAPSNIAARNAIRSTAITLLRRLHDEEARRYDRIVVVGHSLGSVIAYDALTHLWQERHSHLAAPSGTVLRDQPVLEEMSRVAREMDQATGAGAVTAARRYRELQPQLLLEQQAIGVSWRISDFVTLGSPLAHAPFVIAGNLDAFRQLTHERMLPTSPPQLEDRRDEGQLVRSFDFPEAGPDGRHSGTRRILHHAALFACTRWTNLFFPGDLIGGRLAPFFGPGIVDLPVRSRRWGGLWQHLPVSHVGYWRRDDPDVREGLLRGLDVAAEADADAGRGARPQQMS